MRTLRKAQNLTLEALQRKTRVPMTRLLGVDSGAISPFLSEADAIARALGTTIDALVHGTAAVRGPCVFRNISSQMPAHYHEQRPEKEETDDIL